MHLWRIGIVLSIALTPGLLRADLLANYDFEVVESWEETYQLNFGLSSSHDTNTDTDASFYQTRAGAFSSFDSGVTPIESGFQNHAFAFSTNTESVGDPNGNNFFHEFDVTIQNGAYELDELTFDYWVNNTENTGNFSVSVYSDATGFAIGDELIQYDYVQQTNQAVEIQQVEVTGLDQIAAFQNLGVGDQVEFRLVFNDNFPNGFVHRVDNIQLTGNSLTAVPEPAAASLLAMLGIAGFVRRRR